MQVYNFFCSFLQYWITLSKQNKLTLNAEYVLWWWWTSCLHRLYCHILVWLNCFCALLRGRIFCKTKVMWTEVLFWDFFFFLPFRKISIYVWTRPETHVSRQEHDSLKHISTQACRGLHTNTHTLADTHLRKRATCVTSTHPQLPLRTRLLT